MPIERHTIRSYWAVNKLQMDHLDYLSGVETILQNIPAEVHPTRIEFYIDHYGDNVTARYLRGEDLGDAFEVKAHYWTGEDDAD